MKSIKTIFAVFALAIGLTGCASNSTANSQEGAQSHAKSFFQMAPKPMVVSTPGLQWLILPSEGSSEYTNWGDGREGDASALVAGVNADRFLGAGFNDWRMPTVEELKRIRASQDAPKEGFYWSSTPYIDSNEESWSVDFSTNSVYHDGRYYGSRVRLVRANR